MLFPMLLPGGRAGGDPDIEFQVHRGSSSLLCCCCVGDTGESLKFGQNTSKEKQQAVLQLLSNTAAWIDR